MAITSLHSYLVYPAKADDAQPRIGGAALPTKGLLYEMLRGVYDKSDSECNIAISFNHDAGGAQKNDCRDLLIKYVGKPTLLSGRRIAASLQRITTKRSGLGLLFLMAGNDAGKHKLVLSRFPADSGILAEQKHASLNVAFLEKVFMKNATAYKAAIYVASSTKSGFWDGRAVDKQINQKMLALSDYWIKEFLLSDLKTTSAAGTKRLANAIRQAISQSPSLSVKEELVAAARLAPSLQGRSISMSSFAKRFGLSTEATAALREQLPSDHLFTEQFLLSKHEFDTYIAFESAELSNGGLLMAPAGKFDAVFKERKLPGGNGEVEITTKGRVVDRKLRKTKT